VVSRLFDVQRSRFEHQHVCGCGEHQSDRT
jgi:hypothetical protein